jgi:phage terminase Nu1 subunit (DNA packaging protein)
MKKSPAFSRLSQQDVADMHGVDVRTVRRWDEEGHPRRTDGTYVAAKSIEWRLARLNLGALDLDGERARLAKLQADRLQVDLRARSGDLLQRDRLEQAWSMSLAACRDSLLGIPRRLANELVGEQDDRVIARRIDEEIRHAFKAMVLEFSKPAHSDGAQSAEPPAGNA